MRKTGLTLLIACILGWNIYLSYELLALKQNDKDTLTSETTVIEKVVTDFETNITQVYEDVVDKVVVVTNYYNSNAISSGSGVVYKVADGQVLIITNHHVIESGNAVLVKFHNGEEVEAQLLGSDQYTDLALLSVSVDFAIEAIALGDSSLAKVGEHVLAIGSPISSEFTNSATFGIISGKDRTVPVDLTGDGISDWDMIVMQTDAAINPGNSGGALVNMAGELIGINSLKITNADGMGFAIPISEIVPILQQIETEGRVIYPIVGISGMSISELSSYQRIMYDVPESVAQGVMIVEISENGPAEKAELQQSDIIVEFNGQEVVAFKDFRALLYRQKVGDTVTLGIVRDGERLEFEVVLE